MAGQEHWEKVYREKGAEGVSWFRPHLERSLHFIDCANLAPGASIIDVGGGASTLVDDLLQRGFSNVTVLDLSAEAIGAAQVRLGDNAHRVRWRIADVCAGDLPAAEFDFWHDRAVFHFLKDREPRQRYLAAVRRSLKLGGHIVVATFGPEGPERCSGLEVVRYDADVLHAQFGADFVRLESATEMHTTPWGSEQQFVYCYCRAT